MLLLRAAPHVLHHRPREPLGERGEQLRKEDQASKTKPADWYNAVVAAKGDPGAVVMLAIQPQALPMGEQEKPGCTYDGQDHMLTLRDFIKMFPFHDEGNTCAASYVPFFETAAGRVAEACAAFIPG